MAALRGGIDDRQLFNAVFIYKRHFIGEIKEDCCSLTIRYGQAVYVGGLKTLVMVKRQIVGEKVRNRSRTFWQPSVNLSVRRKLAVVQRQMAEHRLLLMGKKRQVTRHRAVLLGRQRPNITQPVLILRKRRRKRL